MSQENESSNRAKFTQDIIDAHVNERQQLYKLQEKLLQAHQMGARINFQNALDINTSIAGSDRANVLWQRHISLYKAPEIAEAIMSLGYANDPTKINKIRAHINENGGFIENNSLSDFETRASDPDHWVIGEASGRHPDWNSIHHLQEKVAADCQCCLPDDVQDAERVVPLLDGRKDIIFDKAVQDRIKKSHPASVGLISDLGVEQEFAHLRLAAAARYAACLEVISKSKNERKYYIEHLIGLAFCIQGLEVGEKSLMLHSFEQKNLSNMISLLVNEQSKRCPATIVGKLRNCKVPVSFMFNNQEMNGNLLVDWFYLDHETDHISR